MEIAVRMSRLLNMAVSVQEVGQPLWTHVKKSVEMHSTLVGMNVMMATMKTMMGAPRHVRSREDGSVKVEQIYLLMYAQDWSDHMSSQHTSLEITKKLSSTSVRI